MMEEKECSKIHMDIYNKTWEKFRYELEIRLGDDASDTIWRWLRIRIEQELHIQIVNGCVDKFTDDYLKPK